MKILNNYGAEVARCGAPLRPRALKICFACGNFTWMFDLHFAEWSMCRV